MNRTCVGCTKVDDAKQLIRFIVVDEKPVADRYAPGRGAWAHRQCLAKAVKRHGFSRSFRTKIFDEAISLAQLTEKA